MPTNSSHIRTPRLHRAARPAVAGVVAVVATAVLIAITAAQLRAGAEASSFTRDPAEAAPATGRLAASNRLAGMVGVGDSGLQIQNRDCDPSAYATIVIDYYRQPGGSPSISLTRPGVGACAAANVYNGGESRLTNGRYASIISADRLIATLERTVWNATGASTLGSQSEPGTDVVLPWVVKAAGGMTSIVSAQNTDPSRSSTAQFSIYPAGDAAPVVTFDRDIPPGTSVTLDFGGMRNGELVRLPAGFVGHLRVRAATPVAVQSFVDWETVQKGVAAFEGVPAHRAAEELYAPLVYNLAANGKTWIAVANPGSQDVDVTVTYRARGHRCPATPIVHGGGAHRIPAGAMLVFDQRPDQIPPPPPGISGLPAGCVGSATIEATGGGKVVAAVVATGAVNTSLAAYTPGGLADGGRLMLLPLYRNRHTAAGISTGIAAMNLGSAPTTAILEVYDSTGKLIATPCPECAQTIAPLDMYAWDPPSMPSMQPYLGSYGSAKVRADQPLAVVVNEASGNGSMDASMYTGIAAVDDPVATPSPGGTPAATPTPTSTPANGYVPIYLVNANIRDDGARPWVTHRLFLPFVERP